MTCSTSAKKEGGLQGLPMVGVHNEGPCKSIIYFDQGGNLNAAGISYNTPRAAEIMNRIEKMEGFARPGN